MKELIEKYFNSLKKTLDSLDRKEIEDFIKILNKARLEGRRIFIMGNGGSGSTASHFACDFNKLASFYFPDKPRFKVECLNDNFSTMMAYSNDESYELVFSEQLKNFLEKGDVVIALSGSGNSKNVLNAIEYANQAGAVTVGLTGYNGGRLKQIAQYSINTNIEDMQISEDIHLILTHLAMKAVNS